MPYFSFLFPIFFIGMAVGVMYILAKKAWWGLAANYLFDRDRNWFTTGGYHKNEIVNIQEN